MQNLAHSIPLTLDLWQMILGVIAVVGWFLKLERRITKLEDARVAAVEKEVTEALKQIEAQERKHSTLEARVLEQLASIQAMLARIEGQMEALKGK